jgi:hypothetical protein
MTRHVATVVLIAVGSWMTPRPSHAQTRPALQGTFMQLRVDQRWTDARLRALFLDFRRLGLSRLVVQWTVVGNNAFYPSHTFEALPDPPVEPILALGDEFGIRVRVGLAHDPEFWKHIGIETAPRDLEAYLQRLRRRSIAAARELAPLVRQHRSFEGWFLTEEIDDVNWLVPERRVLMRSYLADLRDALHSLEPAANVAVSGFSNAYCDPATLEAFWRELLSASHIDVLLFQDGIGAHKLELRYCGLYLAAIRRAAEGSGRALSVVAELFDQVEGPPVTDGSFKAVPAQVDRLERQIGLAGEASTDGIFAFSVPDYMVPDAGADAGRLFTDYLKRYRAAGGSSR